MSWTFPFISPVFVEHLFLMEKMKAWQYCSFWIWSVRYHVGVCYGLNGNRSSQAHMCKCEISQLVAVFGEIHFGNMGTCWLWKGTRRRTLRVPAHAISSSAFLLSIQDMRSFWHTSYHHELCHAFSVDMLWHTDKSYPLLLMLFQWIILP